jgi:hypothetical protein
MAQKGSVVIGQLFSDSDSDEDDRRYYTSASEKRKPKIAGRSIQTSADEKRSTKKLQRAPLPPATMPESKAPDGYVELNKKNIPDLAYNTIIQYKKKGEDSIIANKYFKKYDQIAGTIMVGQSPGKKGPIYTQNLGEIDAIYVRQTAGGAPDDQLSGTIEVPQAQWKYIKRDTIISYKRKHTGNWIYRVKFNSYFKSSKDNSTRMNLSSETGNNYRCDPSQIAEIRRHVSDTDFKLASILQELNLLKERMAKLERHLR